MEKLHALGSGVIDVKKLNKDEILTSDSALNQQEMNIDEYLNFSALEELWLLA
jgi:hypothetical protein